MKKIIAYFLAMGLCLSAFSCSSGSAEETETGTFTAEKLSDAAYKTEKAELPDGAGVLFLALPYNGGENFLVVGTADVSPAFWTANRDFTEFTRVDYPDFDAGISYNMAVSGRGEAAALVVHADYGDLPAPDPASADYDEAKYDAAAEYSLHVMRYAADGSLISDETVTDFPEEVGKRTAVGGAAYDGEYLLGEIDGDMLVFSADGRYVGELTGGEGEIIREVSCDSSGTLICAVDTADDKIELRKVNGGDCSLESGGASYDIGEMIQQMTSGSGEYSLFIRTRSTIYGIKSANSSIEPLFSVNAADLNNNLINSFFLGSDGMIRVCITDYAKWKTKITKFIPCDPENIVKLRVGVEGAYLDSEIEEYNDSSPTVPVELVDYDASDTDEAISQFEQDILSANLPDVLVMHQMGVFKSIDVQGKGVLIDLYPYMEKDETLQPGDIFPNLLDLLMTDGKVYDLPSRFGVDMGYICKTKYADELIHDDWSFDTFMDVLENMPEGMKVCDFYENDTQWGRHGFASNTWWVDAENATCHFDSESYIRFLRYCAGGKPDSEIEYNDSSDPDEGYKFQQRQYLNDTTLFMRFLLGSFDGYMSDIKGSFGGEPVSYLGIPGFDGGYTYISTDGFLRSFGITKDSSMPDAAWDFISSMVNYDYEGNNTMVLGFPITERGFYDLAERSRYDDRPRWNNMTENGYEYSDGENDYNIGPLTDEDIDFIHECLINAGKPPMTLRISNRGYHDILDSETQAMFAGETTPEQCAEYIQNRMSIYLSENFG